MKYWKSLAVGCLIVCAGVLFFGIGVFAQEKTFQEQWIVDPQSRLSLATTSHLNLMLGETAAEQGIYIRVFIINDESSHSIDVQSLETLQAWDAANIHRPTHNNWGSLVINTHTAQGKVWLKSKGAYSQYLEEGLRNLESLGITPALLEGDLEKAIFQGVIGLSTLLKEPPVVKPRGSIDKLISLYHTSAAFHFFVMLVFLGLTGWAIMLYLRSPVTPREPDLDPKGFHEA